MSPLLGRQPARGQPGDLLPPAGLHGICRPEGGDESGGRAGGQGDISEEGYIQKEAIGETAMTVTVYRYLRVPRNCIAPYILQVLS